MKLSGVVIAALSGTTLMTAFSYAVSELTKNQFKEPQLLNKLVARADPRLASLSKHHITGWLLHYFVGFLFSSVYDNLWQKSNIKPNVLNSLKMGAVTGVVGISVWKITFYLHPDPPKIHFRKFYSQLFIAHLIFGFFAMKGYRLMEPRHLL